MTARPRVRATSLRDTARSRSLAVRRRSGRTRRTGCPACLHDGNGVSTCRPAHLVTGFRQTLRQGHDGQHMTKRGRRGHEDAHGASRLGASAHEHAVVPNVRIRDQVPGVEASAGARAHCDRSGIGRAHRARSVHRYDPRRAGVQVVWHRGDRGRQCPVRGDVRALLCRDATRDTIDRGRTSTRGARRSRRVCRPSTGYVTEVFAGQARYLQPHNAARIDAIRDTIDRDWRGHPYEPILLTSLRRGRRSGRLDHRRADGVRQAVGAAVATAVAASQSRPCRPAAATRCTATRARSSRDGAHFDLAYLDPPYNQHRYTANYHVWETIVAWDAPAHYGVACKREDLRDPATRSVFNSRRTMPVALHQVIDDLDADLLVVSCSNEGWVGVDELRAWCERRGHVDVIGFDSRRYVGAQIGVFNPQGDRVGEVSHLHNVEYLVSSGDRAAGAARAVQSSSELDRARRPRPAAHPSPRPERHPTVDRRR